MSVTNFQRFAFDNYQDYDPSDVYHCAVKHSKDNAHIQCFDIPSNVDLRFDILYPQFEIQIVATSKVNYSSKRCDVKIYFTFVPLKNNTPSLGMYKFYYRLLDQFYDSYTDHCQESNDEHQQTLKNEYRYF